MTTRTITGKILRTDGKAYTQPAVTYTLLEDLITSTAIYPKGWSYNVVTSPSGSHSADLPVPDVGSTQYMIKIINDDDVYCVHLEDGAATDLQTLLSLETFSVSQDAIQTVIDAHAGGYLHSSINVKSYGAIGDGSTDDTDAISAAFEVANEGDEVYFPAGTYLIKATSGAYAFLVDQAKMRITGVGAGSILKIHPSAGQWTKIFKVSADDAVIENLCFDGSTNADGTCIEVDECDRTTVRNCHFILPAVGIFAENNVHDLLVVNNHSQGDGYLFLGYHPDGSERWNISNNIIRGDLTGNYGGCGISIDAPTAGFSGAVIANNVISNCNLVGTNGGIGIALARVSHAVITGNYVFGCKWEGIHVEDRSSDVVIVGNYANDNNWAGIDVMPTAAGECSDILISGNTVRNNCLAPSLGHGNGGIEIGINNNNVRNIQVSNNMCIENKAAGIYFIQAYPIQINGNFCLGNSEGIYGYNAPNCVIAMNICKNSTQGAGIHLVTLTAGLVTGNNCFDDQTPKTQTYGLHAEGNAYGARAENNSLSGNFFGPVNDESTGILPGVVLPWIWGGYTLGTLIGKYQVFDHNGNSLGWVPVYDAIT